MQNSALPEAIGNYLVKEQLGSGENTSVLLVQKKDSAKKYVLKLYYGPYRGDPVFRKRFEREFGLVQNLQHPNLVQYIDAAEYKGFPYIVMEYLEGASLQRLLVHHGMTPLTISTHIMTQVLDTLAYLHKSSIIHRDIKPSAIFINPSGLVKLADFDLAKKVGDDTLTIKGNIIGSPRYMAPEQRLGERATQRTDIYGAGIIFYEMLAGRTPWDNDNNEFLPTDRRAWSNLILPSQITGEANRLVDEIILKAIDLQPSHRYQSALDMQDAIKKLPHASQDDVSAWARGRKIRISQVKAIQNTNQDKKIESSKSNNSNRSKPKQKGSNNVPSWLFIGGIGVFIGLLIAIVGYFAINNFISVTSTPTPASPPALTATQAPQIIILTLDTNVQDLSTGGSLLIPANSKVTIINPDYAICEVLADWNGTQVVVPAKAVFPDRTTCP